MQVDLSNCEREQIHLLGKIQAHGLLLAFDSSDKRLSHYSQNALGVLLSEEEAQERPSMYRLIPEDLVKFAENFISGKNSRNLYPDTVTLPYSKTSSTTAFNATVAAVAENESLYKCHLSDGKGHCILEFELLEPDHETSSDSQLSWLDDATSSLDKIDTETILAAEISAKFRQFTGFDRVMVYRFDENYDGEVIGEDKAFGLDSLLGLRYPASDIPSQARELYKSNLTRAIRDVDDTGIPLVAAGENGKNVAAQVAGDATGGDGQNVNLEATLDQSNTIYRSVSPIHIQYLKNMGVRATHANSLMVGGELWGMLICHHYAGPKHLDLRDRLTSLFYAKYIERWLEEAKMRYLQTRNASIYKLLEHHELNLGDDDLFKLIRSCWNLFTETLHVDGFGIQSGEDYVSWPEGIKPPSEALEDEGVLFGANSAIAFRDRASVTDPKQAFAGFAAVSLRKKPRIRLIFFRKEKSKIYKWAGNPNKAVIPSDSDDPMLSLSPRKSFELWQEKVSDEAIPWSDEDRQLLIRLRDVLRRDLNYTSVGIAPDDDLGLTKEANKQLRKENLQLSSDLEKLNTEQSHRDSIVQETVKMNLAKSNLLANLSHEIRTPLNGIIGLANLLKEHADSQVSEYAGHIKQSGQRMLLMFTKLLSFSKLAKDEIQKSDGICSLEDMIASTLYPFQLASKEKGITLHTVIHNKSTQVVTDRFLIEQILSNLVGNAIKYTPVDGHVEVDIKCIIQEGEYAIKLTVEDSGRGIAKSEHNRIFEPFYTVEKTAHVHDNSTGLGLYLIRSYINTLGGSISLESEQGKGTLFTVIIPVGLYE